MENAIIQKFKCDILGDFQTLCTSRCYYGGPCQITVRTRSFCQACRLEKCLHIGMDPSRIKKRRIPSDQLFEYANRNETEFQDQTSQVMKIVSDFLTLIPKETSRPLLQVKELSITHSYMPFTTEEFAFCQKLKEIQASVWKSIPLPLEVMEELIYRTNSRANLVPRTIIENAKHTVVRRYLGFADHLDSFQDLGYFHLLITFDVNNSIKSYFDLNVNEYSLPETDQL